MVAANGDLRAVGVFLLWADLADDQCVGDLLTSIDRDVMLVDNKEGISTLDAFSCALRVLSYSLAEAAHLIGVGRGPGGGVLGVFTELFIEYYKIHGIGAGCVCLCVVINGRVRRLWCWWKHGEDGAGERAVGYWVVWGGMFTFGYPWWGGGWYI